MRVAWRVDTRVGARFRAWADPPTPDGLLTPQRNYEFIRRRETAQAFVQAEVCA